MNLTKSNPVLVLVVAFLGGCAAQAVSSHMSATAVAAQTVPSAGIFQECISATVMGVSGRELSTGVLPSEPTRIPAGWHVVGGGGSARPQPFVLLCR